VAWEAATVPADPTVQAADGPLDDEDRAAVIALAERVAAADGAEALSEATVIGLGREGSRHAFVRAGAEGTDLVAYAQVWVDGSCELAVDPGHRRRGLGTRVLASARKLGAERFWAHGALPAAAAAAASWGLHPVRELRHMTRPLTEVDATDVELPPGYTVRTFVPGADDAAWLRTNARAFADHPEQGRVGQEDLDALLAQPWFDAGGFFVVESDGDDAGSIAAFHWTKHVPGTDEGWAHGSGTDGVRRGTGEVFVVGVDPDHQGQGLAGPLTRLGLAHLARLGLATVELYVDGLNERAVRTYERIGFGTDTVDVVYA
jgi:mycothiol synthase